MINVPLSLYIHFPWCIRKCPYCDFNSYTLQGDLQEKKYIETLLRDLSLDLSFVQNREIISIFMGGGTPSLFSANSMQILLDGIRQQLSLAKDCEITMEMNPGAVEHDNLSGYLAAGINRLSIGIQSFSPQQLKALGRVHTQEEAINVVANAQAAGFSNINLDLMYALPQQTVEEALHDLQQAIALKPQHLSWYHLTIEPNTEFFNKPPIQPEEDICIAIEEQGKTLLQHRGFSQYEISAYSIDAAHQAKHNRNYWEFGDYLGIGAGAHSKITNLSTGIISRYTKHRTPNKYLADTTTLISNTRVLSEHDNIMEFLFNALRLAHGIPISYFSERTGKDLSAIKTQLSQAQEKGWLIIENNTLTPTKLGQRFLNNLLELF